MNRTNKFLLATLILLELIAVAIIVVTSVWIGHQLGGMHADNEKGIRNIHMWIMPVAAVVISSNGAILYRMFRRFSARNVKWAHFVVETVAMIGIAIGLWAAIVSHEARPKEKMPKQHFFSPHSWVGIFTVFIYFCQWIGGLVVFLLKVTSRDMRELFSAAHGFFGILTILFSGMTSVMGIQAAASALTQPEDSKITSEALYGSVLSALIIFFIAFTLYISINPYFEWDVDDETNSPNPIE